jgi:hypothetical protein
VYNLDVQHFLPIAAVMLIAVILTVIAILVFGEDY